MTSPRGSRFLALSLAATILAAACGGGSAERPAATTAAAVATLPPAGTTAAVTLPPTPTPTVAATKTASPAPTPTTAATAGSASLVAAGKVVWQTAGGKGCQSCHGIDGKGGKADDGTTAPNIRGATRQKLLDALGGGAPVMSTLKLTEAEIDAVLAYLAYLDQQ